MPAKCLHFLARGSAKVGNLNGKVDRRMSGRDIGQKPNRGICAIAASAGGYSFWEKPAGTAAIARLHRTPSRLDLRFRKSSPGQKTACAFGGTEQSRCWSSITSSRR
jgi:hypothetical protein